MATPFDLQLVTVTEALFEGEAEALELRGLDGDLTVLAHHEPFMTRVEPCTVKVKTHTEELTFAINGGVLEVADNKAVVLCSMHEQDLPA